MFNITWKQGRKSLIKYFCLHLVQLLTIKEVWTLLLICAVFWLSRNSISFLFVFAEAVWRARESRRAIKLCLRTPCCDSQDSIRRAAPTCTSPVRCLPRASLSLCLYERLTRPSALAGSMCIYQWLISVCHTVAHFMLMWFNNESELETKQNISEMLCWDM